MKVAFFFVGEKQIRFPYFIRISKSQVPNLSTKIIVNQSIVFPFFSKCDLNGVFLFSNKQTIIIPTYRCDAIIEVKQKKTGTKTQSTNERIAQETMQF